MYNPARDIGTMEATATADSVKTARTPRVLIADDQADVLESLRRETLDLYASWGYQLVMTPFVEYLDALLVGKSHDLDLHTFKVTDQLSGRMMGIRADMTPQVARIDAHCLNRAGAVRLCYADSVLHTKPRGLLTSRVPFRIGAELFGHAGPEADVELTHRMAEVGRLVGIPVLDHLVVTDADFCSLAALGLLPGP